MKKRICAVFLLLMLAASGLSAVEVFLAPLPLQDEMGNVLGDQEKPEADLLEAMKQAITGDELAVKPADMEGAQPPRSFLDAARLTENGGYAYLLYGYVKKTEYSYQAEVKLLERERKEVVSVFFAGDDRAHYERLMADLAGKITSYFYTEVGVKPAEKGPEPERNLLSIPASLGWWTPAQMDWGRSLVGLAAVHGGIRLIPVKASRLYLAIGADLEYQIGKNQTAYENFVLHTLKVRLPIQGLFEMGKGQTFGLWLGPLFQMDLLAQAAHYADPYVGLTAVMGLSFGILYRSQITDTLAVGLDNVFDVAVYTPALLTYSPRVFVEFALARQGE